MNTATSFGKLRISLSSLAENIKIFRHKVPNACIVAGVVKADAYGLGMTPVARELWDEGCRDFFVATPGEALALRALLPQAVVAVLGGGLPEMCEEYRAHDILPVLNSLEDIAVWRMRALQEQKILPAIIHRDTGMNRLGLGDDEAQKLLADLELLQGLDVKLIMSHFACADEKDHPLTALQHKKFAAFAKHFPKARKSLANSSGIFRSKNYHYDMVRPGMALYGLNPTPETKNPMNPVVTLEAKILQIRNLKAGDTIGYSATHRFDKDAVTATIGLGYADGFLRSNSGKAKVFWNGIACPVVGRVSMDLVTIDLTHLPEPRPKQGDFVEVIGPHQNADDLAALAGTIGYEILTSLGSRYQRIYRG